MTGECSQQLRLSFQGGLACCTSRDVPYQGDGLPVHRSCLEPAERHLSLRSVTSGAALWSDSVSIPSSACHHLRAQTPSQGQKLNQDPLTRTVLDLPTPEAGNKEPSPSP